MTLVGADADAMRSGLGVLLRQALVDFSGVQSASISITKMVTNFTTTTVAELSGLVNSTANATTTLNISSTTPGPAEAVALTDTALNGPLPNRGSRLLQGGGGSCSPVSLVNSSLTTVTVPTILVDLDVALPYAFHVEMNSTMPVDLAAAAAVVRARIQALLVNGSVTTTSMTSFLTAYSACTGLPASPGVIVGISQPVLVGIVLSTPTPAPDVATGVIIASVFGGLVSAACCCAICFSACALCRRRAEGSAHAAAAQAKLNRDGAAAAAVSSSSNAKALPELAGVAAFIDVPAPARCRLACSDAAAGKVTVSAAVTAAPGSQAAAAPSRATARCCPHITVRDVAAALALVYGVPAAELNAAAVVCGGRILTVGIAAEGAVEVKALGGQAGRSLFVEVRFGATAAAVPTRAAANAVAADAVISKVADDGEPRLTSYSSV